MIAMSETFREVNMSNHKGLIFCLDKVISELDFDQNKCQIKKYSLVEKEYARSQVEPKKLEEIIDGEEPKQNLLKYYVNFSELNKQIINSFNGYNGSIKVDDKLWLPKLGFNGWNSIGKKIILNCMWSKEKLNSFFRYKDPFTEKIHTIYQKNGWNFYLLNSTEYVFTCIYSETDLLSFNWELNLS